MKKRKYIIPFAGFEELESMLELLYGSVVKHHVDNGAGDNGNEYGGGLFDSSSDDDEEPPEEAD